MMAIMTRNKGTMTMTMRMRMTVMLMLTVAVKNKKVAEKKEFFFRLFKRFSCSEGDVRGSCDYDGNSRCRVLSPLVNAVGECGFYLVLMGS